MLLLVFSYSIGVNIHRPIYRGFFPTLLHAAIFRTELPVIRLLTKEGAECKAQKSEGVKTSFTLSIKGRLMLSEHWWRRDVRHWTYVIYTVIQTLIVPNETYSMLGIKTFKTTII